MRKFAVPKSSRSIIAVFFLCIFITIYAANLFEENTRAKAKLQFDAEVEESQNLIHSRLADYEEVLFGARGLYRSVENLNGEKWQSYVNSLELNNIYPGIQGIGLALKTTPQNKDKFINDYRNEGLTSYTINPDGNRDVYYPIVYLLPDDERNKRAIGYDMFSEPIRRQAMERARDDGTTAITGKVTLVQETGNGNQAGFLMYVPLYVKGTVNDTADARRQNHVGYVYSPFRMKDFIDGVLGKGEKHIDFEIYDSTEIKADALLLDTNTSLSINGTTQTPLFSIQRQLTMGGRTWTIYFESKPTFRENSPSRNRFFALAAGLLLSTLITGIYYLLANSRANAISLAEEMFNKAREKEEQYKTVVNALQEGVILQDSSGKVLTFNESALKHLGLSTDQIEGIVPPPDDWTVLQENKTPLPVDKHPFMEVIRTRQPQYDIILGIQLNNSFSRWIKVNALPIFSEDGQDLKYIVTSIEDITAEKKAEDELKQSNLQLMRSNEELQSFAYVASHDLQEPLRKIISFSSLLGSSYKEVLPETGHQYIEVMQRAAKRMSTLINDLLTFSRITTQAQPYASTNLKKITEEVLGDLEFVILEKQAKVDVGELATIEGDEMQLRQLLQNLISNALKYSKENTPPHIKIQTTLDRKLNLCTLSIEDNGIGFEEKYVDRIFTIFQRLHNKFEYDGTGIGLAICKKIVDRHGGSITAKSKLGKGSRFIVKLPIQQNLS